MLASLYRFISIQHWAPEIKGNTCYRFNKLCTRSITNMYIKIKFRKTRKLNVNALFCKQHRHMTNISKVKKPKCDKISITNHPPQKIKQEALNCHQGTPGTQTEPLVFLTNWDIYMQCRWVRSTNSNSLPARIIPTKFSPKLISSCGEEARNAESLITDDTQRTNETGQ